MTLTKLKVISHQLVRNHRTVTKQITFTFSCGFVLHSPFSNLNQKPFIKMPINSRVLTCSYNRRRLRIAPQHHDESTMQMSKPQPNPLKSRVDVQGKPIMLSENSPAWSSVLKETRTLSLDSESDVVSQSSIFRRRTTTTSDRDENDGDMFALKRANPVYESDDEDYFASPSKRQRATEQSILHWDEQC